MTQPTQGRSWRVASCCVVGGGPAGMMLGYLLARAGVDVIVLEKHADFFRDFRGDTIHPSTLDVMAELGVLEEFLRLPHTRVSQGGVVIGEKTFTLIDFRRLPTRCKFMAMMPQWDFLNFIATKAKKYPTFRLEMNAEVTDVLQRGNKIVGVRVATEQGEVEVLADLTVACDGRTSTVRRQAGMSVREFGGDHRRALVPAAERRRYAAADAGVPQGRSDPHNHRPGRLLAVRLHHSQGRIPGDQGAGARGIPRPHHPHRARPALCSQRTERLGSGQAAHSSNGPPRAVVSPWPSVHWRRCPRHVAGGGRRGELRHPGRGCDGEPAGRQTPPWRCMSGGPASGPAA